MYTIYKYEFEVQDDFIIEMPQNAKILTVQVQGLKPCIWALVDADLMIEKRHFKVFGTGHVIGDVFALCRYHYIGTFQEMSGALIWHLFENIQGGNYG